MDARTIRSGDFAVDAFGSRARRQSLEPSACCHRHREDREEKSRHEHCFLGTDRHGLQSLTDQGLKLR